MWAAMPAHDVPRRWIEEVDSVKAPLQAFEQRTVDVQSAFVTLPIPAAVPQIPVAALAAVRIEIHAYVFANARVDRLEVPVHDGFGVWLAARRLNTGRFVRHELHASIVVRDPIPKLANAVSSSEPKPE